MEGDGDFLDFKPNAEDDVVSDKEGSTGDASAETKEKSPDPEPSKEAEETPAENQDQTPNQNQNSNKNKNRGQKRRQRNNVHRIQGVIPSLFPMPVVQESFDLRNVLSGPAAGDPATWWPQRHPNFQQNNHQHNFQQNKKPRTDAVWKKKNNQNSTTEKSEEPVEDILNPLKYAVAAADYPETLLSEEQFDRLQNLLMEEILKIEDEEQVPRFWRSYLRHGALLLFVADEKSKNWLVNAVPNLTLDETIKLKTGAAKDIILTRKINTLVPKLLKDLDDGQVMKLLRNQNTGLRCDLWQVLSCQPDDKGRNFQLAIDEESYKNSRNNSFKAHLGLGIIKFNNVQHYNVVYN